MLWEPTLIRLNEKSLLFQGIEKTGGQGTVQEWIVEPHFRTSQIMHNQERITTAAKVKYFMLPPYISSERRLSNA